MDKTPLDTQPIDDLDYLAQLGYEQVPGAQQEVEALTGKVKAKTFSYNNGPYFALICLLTGIFLGASLFFALYEAPPEPIAVTHEAVIEGNITAITEQAVPVHELDTVVVIRENFIRPKPRRLSAMDTALSARPSYEDSSVSVLSGDVDLSALLKQPLKEDKLRYMANAPVFYIHDLKVTDYRNLYFKRNHFVPVHGTVASFAAKEGATAISELKQNADYFLHEELADAILQFKKGRYDRCIQTLNVVATYNKEDVNCDFYLGLCYYYKRNYAMAISLLDKCTVSLNNTFLQEAMYYKALCLMESGNTGEAQKLFKKIAEEGEFYSEKAKEYLKNAE